MGLGAATWAKMLGSAAVLCIGGPALVYYVSPTEEEIFKVCSLHAKITFFLHYDSREKS